MTHPKNVTGLIKHMRLQQHFASKRHDVLSAQQFQEKSQWLCSAGLAFAISTTEEVGVSVRGSFT